MIMSIPVLNKVKILSQISPHLPAPSVVSPPREIRGAIVAVEGLDPSSVYSMTSSLAEQLVKDGKFSVRIFSGPDPFTSLRDDGTGKEGRKELAIADCLRIIGEWHKISEEIKKFITTKPAPSGQVSPDKDVEMSSMSNSIVMTDVPAKDSSSEPEAKTPDRSRRPRSLDLNPPMSAKRILQESEEQPTSASRISPKSIVTDKTTNLSISTPPVQRHGQWRDPWYKGDNPDSPPYTRIPSTVQRGSGSSPAPQSKDIEMEGTEKEKDKQVHFDASADQTSPQPRPSAQTPNNSISHHAITGDGSIPIALVPHYQLTTVDASAISMPIVDSYSPLAHWQWLATLWRGCIGPDVSVVIKSTAVSGDGIAQGSVSVPPGSNEDSSPGKMGGVSGGIGRDVSGTPVPGSRTASIAAGAGTSVGSAPGSGNAGHPSSVSGPASSSISAAQGAAAGPGVEVRLLDCRAVVVRTNVSAHTYGNGKKGSEGTLRRISEANSEKTAAISKTDAEEVGTAQAGTQMVVDLEKEKKIREDLEFWEKAKRRVGFEVAEFLRR
jgi:hypothetical protein